MEAIMSRICSTCWDAVALPGQRRCDDCSQRRTPGVAALESLTGPQLPAPDLFGSSDS
jgi:hypothetical protein